MENNVKEEIDGVTVETTKIQFQRKIPHVPLHFELVIFAGYVWNRRRERMRLREIFFLFLFVAFFGLEK